MTGDTMQEGIVRSEGAPLTRRGMLTREALVVEKEQRSLLKAFVEEMMVEGQDYGIIPGTAKPTLLKPGAEKLLDLFRCTPEFFLVTDHCHEDFKEGFFKYTFSLRVYGPNGSVLAEGYGSANSMEARYRWRDGKRKCPECGHAEALLKSKKEPGFFCWDKKGGCGANFKPDDRRITEQVVGKVPNPDIADLDNTILKMAKKRALVDGAIALARCSDMFTQDVEDFMQHGPPDEAPPATATPPAEEPPKKQRKTKEADGAGPNAVKENAPAKLLTLEEAEKKDRTKTLVGFGAFKSLAIAALDDVQLGEALNEGEDILRKDPEHWASNAVRNKVLLLTLEYEKREKAAGVRTMP
jgi:hypothetical protein